MMVWLACLVPETEAAREQVLEELEKAHLEESMIAKLMRQSKQERRIAEQ